MTLGPLGTLAQPDMSNTIVAEKVLDKLYMRELLNEVLVVSD
jgi:hypothetical protein